MKQLIALRREHPVFHMSKEPALLDYKSVGMPDVSYHGLKTWCPMFENYCRQLGILYCGKYGEKDGGDDDYFYVAYNMYWEPCVFALPNLPKKLSWHVAVNTEEEDAIYAPGAESLVMDQKKIMVKARSIVVLIGKEAAGGPADKPVGKKAAGGMADKPVGGKTEVRPADKPSVKKAASPYKTKATKNNRKESDIHVE